MNPLVFREYDIRGVADRDLTDGLAHDLGQAFGTFIRRRGGQRIVLSRDCRVSSDRLHRELKRGLLACGLQLVDIGVGPTPIMYFCVFHLNTDGGVQITGSHNPPEDNGFKLMSGKQTLSGDDIRELRRLVTERDFDLAPGGEVENLDPTPAYEGFIRGNIRLARTDLKLAIDAGNGAGGPTALAALRAAGLNPIAMYCEMDGRFPNHHPDPSEPHNVEELQKRVVNEGLDLGIAYDGDADRIGVIDDQGEILFGDRLMILLARHILARHPGGAILGEVKCSQTMYDDIAAHGGRPIIWKTGHSLIKKKMREEQALLAGEMSGHVFFADRFFGFDDAVYATLRLLEIVAESDQPLSQMLADVPRTHATPEIRVACPDEQKFAVVDKVLEHYRPTHDILDVDGARVNFTGGWGLVRASNTQPSLVLRFEAEDPRTLTTIRQEVEQVVERARAGLSGQ